MTAEVNFACATCGNGLVLRLGDPTARTTCRRCGTEAHLDAAGTDTAAGTGRGLERVPEEELHAALRSAGARPGDEITVGDETYELE